ncbi:MAG: YicC family protein [Candidatus Marinimicrobia bacterium]|nr:YicC family protein [Candidatus Neomarinimicrobiota bacterium]MCH8068803.1 YicC family protein [Candidatus Neomarinimicrobiota bacterium]
MIRSMTGFGTGYKSTEGVSLAVEISSLNSRFLDIRIKLPFNSNSLERVIKQRVKEKCQRGKISVTVSFEYDMNSGNNSNIFDRKKFEAYTLILSTLEKDYDQKINLADVIDLKEFILLDSPEEIDPEFVMQVFDKALMDFIVMTEQEGEMLKNDISQRLDKLTDILSPLEQVCQDSKPEIFKEYRTKIKELLNNIAIDDSRILQETAILAEKADVSEECVRMRSHLKQFNGLLSENKPVGKRLNFLLQEMYREVNTIGSKNNKLKIIRMVIDMKDEIEKIKEQVQNIL